MNEEEGEVTFLGGATFLGNPNRLCVLLSHYKIKALLLLLCFIHKFGEWGSLL